ncbi:hypothetical protein A2W24_02510 [Microgenomates group bacterium RBG_16_45_19]|nr:MAG: hypothetical protein A2W24_02510 [Microgenomates group bacterium RBG_16_45_19]
MDIAAVRENLYLGSKPDKSELKQLQQLGITLVISMLHETKAKEYQATRLGYLRLATFDFFLLPIPMRTLAKGVAVALRIMDRGGKVLVYCKFGRHRSIAMAAAILIGLGYSAEEAMKLIDRQRPEADPYIWYIKRRIEKFETYWARSPR